jgi:hypothetical protein
VSHPQLNKMFYGEPNSPSVNERMLEAFTGKKVVRQQPDTTSGLTAAIITAGLIVPPLNPFIGAYFSGEAIKQFIEMPSGKTAAGVVLTGLGEAAILKPSLTKFKAGLRSNIQTPEMAEPVPTYQVSFQKNIPLGSNKYVFQRGDQFTLKGKTADFWKLQELNKEAGSPYIYSKGVSLEPKSVKALDKVASAQTVLDKTGLQAKMQVEAAKNPIFRSEPFYMNKPEWQPILDAPIGKPFKLPQKIGFEVQGLKVNLNQRLAASELPKNVISKSIEQVTFDQRYIADFTMRQKQLSAGLDIPQVGKGTETVYLAGKKGAGLIEDFVRKHQQTKLYFGEGKYSKYVGAAKATAQDYSNALKSAEASVEITVKPEVPSKPTKPFTSTKTKAPVTTTQGTQSVISETKQLSTPKTSTIGQTYQRTASTQELWDWTTKTAQGRMLGNQIKEFQQLQPPDITQWTQPRNDITTTPTFRIFQEQPTIITPEEKQEQAIIQIPTRQQKFVVRPIPQFSLATVPEEESKLNIKISEGQKTAQQTAQEPINVSEHRQARTPEFILPTPVPNLPSNLPKQIGRQVPILHIPVPEQTRETALNPFLMLKKERNLQIPTQGYNVFLKRFGTLQQINPTLLSRTEALKLGSTQADISLGATFQLKKSGQLMSTRKVRVDLSKFYKKAGSKATDFETYIEKANRRLDAFGETQEIQKARKKKLWRF